MTAIQDRYYSVLLTANYHATLQITKYCPAQGQQVLKSAF